MSTCSCGEVTISCPRGCGCFCASTIDCVRWCEPVQVEAAFDRQAVPEGGIVRTFKAPDGTDRVLINAMAAKPGADLPRHQPGTQLQGCMQEATLESMARVLSLLHGVSVTAPTGRAKETVDERVSGTLDEIAQRFGLTIA